MRLNLDITSMDQMIELDRFDRTQIGTPNYLGIAYFWHYDFRHHLRDVSYSIRKKVHHALVKNNLALDEYSAEHLSIVERITKRH